MPLISLNRFRQFRVCAVVLALCLIAVAPVRAQGADPVRLSPEMWDSLLPVLSAYRRIVLEYNKDVSAESPWFVAPKSLDLSGLAAGTSSEDEQVHEYLKLIVSSMERMRGAHELVRRQTVQLFAHGKELGPLQITMVQTMTMGVAHAYDEWVGAHEGLMKILRERKGYRLAKPYPPLLLRELREVAFPASGIPQPTP